MVTGILIVAVSRWTLAYIQNVLLQHYSEHDELVSAATDEDSAREAMSKAHHAFAPKAVRLRRFVWTGDIGDVLFYGGLLRGLVYILEGFVLS